MPSGLGSPVRRSRPRESGAPTPGPTSPLTPFYATGATMRPGRERRLEAAAFLPVPAFAEGETGGACL